MHENSLADRIDKVLGSDIIQDIVNPVVEKSAILYEVTGAPSDHGDTTTTDFVETTDYELPPKVTRQYKKQRAKSMTPSDVKEKSAKLLIAQHAPSQPVPLTTLETLHVHSQKKSQTQRSQRSGKSSLMYSEIGMTSKGERIGDLIVMSDCVKDDSQVSGTL